MGTNGIGKVVKPRYQVSMDDRQKQELQRLQRIARGRDPWVFLIVVIVGVIVTLMNITSIIMQGHMDGEPSQGPTPWINEPTALIAILCLYPYLRQVASRLPVPPESWPRFFAWHALAALLYSLLEYVLMSALRFLAWPPLAHRAYHIDGNVAYNFLYEMRKQLFIYLVVMACIYAVRALAEQARELRQLREEARSSGMLTLKCGARQIRVAADEFSHAEAAGNYAQVHAGGHTHLARITLAALQEQLQAAGVHALRIHRATLVNMDHVREAAPAGNGDMTLVLANGGQLRASRRYRTALEAALHQA